MATPPADEDSDSFYSLEGSGDEMGGDKEGVAQAAVTSPPSFSTEVVLGDAGGRDEGLVV